MSWLKQFDAVKDKYPNSYIIVESNKISIENMRAITVESIPTGWSVSIYMNAMLYHNRLVWSEGEYDLKFDNVKDAEIRANLISWAKNIPYIDKLRVNHLVT